ncbi:MAG: hypothetical protein FWC32_09340 [Firmicutes bacterium]|nr:hypothetical protein [Bacillota bacterium]
MKKTIPKLMAFVMFITVAIFILSACGRNRNNENDVQDTANNANAGTQGVAHDQQLNANAVLTISAPFGGLTRLEESADAFRQAMANEGIDVQIEFNSYMQDEWQYQSGLLLSKFAAGTGPDIFVRDNILLYQFIENGFLANIYDIIDRSSIFNRDDFFTNALRGMEVNGRLYMLPMFFGIDFVGINANAPASFVSQFEAMDRVSPGDIIAMHAELVDRHPEWADFALVYALNPVQAFTPVLFNTIDFGGRSASFSAYTDFLKQMRPAFYENNRFETPFLNFWALEEEFPVIQERYVFARVAAPLSPLLGLFGYREPFYIYRPLADESGRLLNRAWGTEFVINHTANPDLVMGFINQVMYDDANEDMRFGVNIPILRRHFDQVLEVGFRHTLTQVQLPQTIESQSFEIENAVTRLTEYSTWPSVSLYASFLLPQWGIIVEPINEFLAGEITAREATDQMEARAIEWLNADRGEIEEYVHEPTEELPDLPVRSLTVHTSNRHTGVILQAANALNALWREQDRPYIFQVEVDEYSWTDWEGTVARNERLRTELMAGGGPDMFLFDGMEIHSLAASGFIRNFYELIDADSNSNRDEFFTQALYAFEINNGLYMFPISFGFEYVAINAGLPQEFIDRFTQKSEITLSQMMEFYLDLMYAHGDEFGDLTFGTGGGITWSGNVLQSIMGGFIDFNTRTANLADPKFVEALELMKIVYADWDVTNTWGVTTNTPDFLRDRAREHIFLAMSDGLSSFDAFFTPESPIFKHHIPLVDDYGRLMLPSPGWGQVWSGIFITSVGDAELAWELTRQMIYAYTNPVGRAAVEPIWGGPARWGNQSFATPILRSLFRDHAMRSFVDTYETFGAHGGLQSFVGFDDDANRTRQFEDAVERIASFHDRPMSMLSPMVPTHLFEDAFDQFKRGIITAEAAAQRIQNAVFLWLIE